MNIVRTLSFLPIFSTIQSYRDREYNHKQIILSLQDKLSGEVKLPIHLYNWLNIRCKQLGHKNVNETIAYFIEKSYEDDTKKYSGKTWLEVERILADNSVMNK